MLLEMIPENMANELKYYLVPFHYNGKIPTLNEVISHAKDQVQLISKNSVYDPLKNHKVSAVPKLSKKLKVIDSSHSTGEIPTLNKVTSHAKDQVQSISNSLVYDSLKNHDVSGVRKLSKKLKRLVPIHSNRKNPTLKEVISHARDTKKFSEPIRKEMSNQIPMEQLFLRFPHLSEAICGELNNESLVTWQKVSRPWNMYLNELKLLQVRIIEAKMKYYFYDRQYKKGGILIKTLRNYHKIGDAWKDLFKTASKETLVDLSHLVQKYYRSSFHFEGSTPLNFVGYQFMVLNRPSIELQELLFRTILGQSRDKNPKGFEGQTPLHYAAEKGCLEICTLIMANIEDKNPADNNGWTPLHKAAMNGHLEICHCIMKQVNDKNPKNNVGETPLHRAAMNGHLEICDCIMQQVKDKNPKNNLGITPLHIAAGSGHYEVCDHILQLVDEKNPRAHSGNTPLLFAAMSRNLPIFKLIGSKVADKNPENNLVFTTRDMRYEINNYFNSINDTN